MKCQVLDLKQGWHACHKSCANRFQDFTVKSGLRWRALRKHFTRFKNSIPLSKRHSKDGDDSDGDRATYEDDGKDGDDDNDEDDMEHLVKISFDTAGDLKKTAAPPISRLPAQNNHNSLAK